MFRDLRRRTVARAIAEIESLEPGTCLIMKGNLLMTKKTYLRSWKRAIEFTLNYNIARVAVRIAPRGRQKPLTRWNNALENKAGN